MDIAKTIWRPTDGIGEYGLGSNDPIIDPMGNFLVDPSGNQIVSPDGTFTNIPKTVWISEDGS